MAVSIDVNQIDELAATVVVESDREPPVDFAIYHDGVGIERFSDPDGVFTRLVTAAPGEQVFFAATDLAGARPQPAFPTEFTLNWQEAVGASAFRIEKWSGSGWTEVKVLPASGNPAEQWRTGRLADCEHHRFRVTPIDEYGVAGSPVEFSGKMVRIPDVPAVDYTLDAETSHLTISEAE